MGMLLIAPSLCSCSRTQQHLRVPTKAAKLGAVQPTTLALLLLVGFSQCPTFAGLMMAKAAKKSPKTPNP